MEVEGQQDRDGAVQKFGQNVRVGLRSLMNGIGAGSEEMHNTDIFLSLESKKVKNFRRDMTKDIGESGLGYDEDDDSHGLLPVGETQVRHVEGGNDTVQNIGQNVRVGFIHS